MATIPSLLKMRDAGEKIATLTCYDASFASLMDRCGVDLLLVGDSLGNVCQGQGNTLPVTLADIAYHTAAVARGNKAAVLAADMPFGTYATPQAAFDNAVWLIHAGAHVVKLEGCDWLADTVAFLTERGVPGFKVQGKTTESAERLKADALTRQDTGAYIM
ncbi:3-methyl-2-oxobutanoate hydroxymethyltransferase [Pseudoduganella namucuonensis]|uniref:3-methyl-2-oxobutanoate hydroxymethyltransferase n=1 Tax=Pseudoduganella namucuonensis TaxID=1035707 RepID=A0A1I7JMZ7_9BURK|nr:3-methyl-2-oxobutanoate hydroxymethyltransferase [Pseudoduganella namucuonensis]